MLLTVLHSSVVRGAIAGILAAAVVDLHAFLSWRTTSDFRQYAWSTAAIRWGQGAITGALTGAGLGAVIS